MYLLQKSKNALELSKRRMAGDKMKTYSLILLAAGMGKRTGLEYNKMFYKINNNEIIYYTLKAFLKDENLNDIVLVISESEREQFKKILFKFHEHLDKIKVAYGGKERQDSVYNGLKMIDESSEIILVHDGARPFITVETVRKAVLDVEKYGFSVVGTKVIDTIKKIENGKIVETVDRTNLWAVQTPQGAKTSILKEVHELAKEDNFYATDEAGLIERYMDIKPSIVEGSYDNIKITTNEHLDYAEMLVEKYFK